MGCLLAIFAACFPRLALALTALLSGFIGRAIPDHAFLWGVVGFLFFPLSFLWYCAIQNWFDGSWGCFQIVVMALCLSADLGSNGKAGKEAKDRASPPKPDDDPRPRATLL